MCLGRSTTKDAYLIKDINKSGPNDPGRITGSGSAAGMSEGEEDPYLHFYSIERVLYVAENCQKWTKSKNHIPNDEEVCRHFMVR